MPEPTDSGLTEFQADVTLLFFAIPESRGFLFAGAGALLAQGLTHRPTEDLDFFGTTGRASIRSASDALRRAIETRGWTVEVVREFDTFCRMRIAATDDLVIDLAIDSAPLREPRITVVGPSFDPVELAARKMLALFSRAEPRDFSDVYELVGLFGKGQLLSLAANWTPVSTSDASQTACADCNV